MHSKVKAKSKKETERVGKYMIKPLLSLKTLLHLISIWKSISFLAFLRIFLPFIASSLAFSYI